MPDALNTEHAVQMCDAPSDVFSEGQWCEAANVLAAALEQAKLEVEERFTKQGAALAEAAKQRRRAETAERMLAAVVRAAAPGGRFLRVPPVTLRERLVLHRTDAIDGSIQFCAVSSNPLAETEAGVGVGEDGLTFAETASAGCSCSVEECATAVRHLSDARAALDAAVAALTPAGTETGR